MKFRKKPVVIDAIQFTDYDSASVQKIRKWAGKKSRKIRIGGPGNNMLEIDTLEGKMLASVGDWIICGVKGEIYPCKPDIFEQSYEKV